MHVLVILGGERGRIEYRSFRGYASGWWGKKRKEKHTRNITKPVAFCKQTDDDNDDTYFRAGIFFLIKSRACFDALATFSACSGSKRRSTEEEEEEAAAEDVAVDFPAAGNTDTLDVSLDVMIPAAVAVVVPPTADLIPLERPSSSLITAREERKEARN